MELAEQGFSRSTTEPPATSLRCSTNGDQGTERFTAPFLEELLRLS